MARANGVGPKLAARIAQELAGKAPPRGFLAHAAGPAPANAGAGMAGQDISPARQEALSALINLGIDSSTATRAVANALKQSGEQLETSALIRAALKEIST